MIESLPADLQSFIRAQVLAGNFSSESDVVTQAIPLLPDQEENYLLFRAEAQRRLKSLDEGNYIELNGDEELAQFFEELKQEVRDKHAVKQEQQ
jgi:Arc/MetJ-type ribon-helix-helix transcriptional regulator